MRRHGGHHVIATVRDVVEVVAILAAGAWALYVFAYEQRIKPAAEPPSLLLTGELHKVGERQGLLQVEYTARLRNTGTSSVAVIATGFTANAYRFASSQTPTDSHPYPSESIYQRDGRQLPQTLIYRKIDLTRFAEKANGGGFTLSPGEELPFSEIFIVKKGEFDAVNFDGSIAYAKEAIDGAYPTRVIQLRNGAVYFESKNGNPDYDTMQVTLDRLSLW